MFLASIAPVNGSFKADVSVDAASNFLAWGMWWLSRGCGGSVGDVVAQKGMWWLSRGCGGSVGKGAIG
jgi:hypothetical protein